MSERSGSGNRFKGAVALVSHPFRAAEIPGVPADRGELAARAAHVTVRFSEAERASAVAGLGEVEQRAKAHGAELGDLGPPAEACGQLGRDLGEINRVIARLQGLLEYCFAWRTVHEETARRWLDDAYEQAAPRIERGLLPADSYAHVRAYGEAHAAAVARGRERAQRARAAVKGGAPARPANDVQGGAKKTGTDER